MSGSWGNCHYIRAGTTSILIDAGQSGKRILSHMEAAGCDPASSLSAILVTHAHSDHIMGVSVLARKFRVEVCATEGTWFEMGAIAEEIPPELRRTIDSEEQWDIGSLRLEAFPTSHDALESVGFVVRDGEATLGIATDCGVFTTRMERVLQGMQALVLEANHDEEMLRTGKYPYYLKRRIAGIHGHLSNDDAAAALTRISGERLRYVLLAHLSQENNTRDKALASAGRGLSGVGTTMTVAPRSAPGAWIVVGADVPAIACPGQ